MYRSSMICGEGYAGAAAENLGNGIGWAAMTAAVISLERESLQVTIL